MASSSELIVDMKGREYRRDPHQLFARLRPRAAVVPARVPFVSNCVFALRYPVVQSVLKDARFANDSDNAGIPHPMGAWWMPRLFRTMQDNMLNRDPPDHRRLRNLVQVAFTPRRVRQMREVTERIVERLLADLEGKGSVDLMSEFALPLPLEILSTMLGIPDAARDDFCRWTTRLSTFMGKGLTGVLRAVRPGNRLLDLIGELNERRRADPQDDLISALLAAEEDGSRLDAREVVSMIFLLLMAGYDTTVNLIGLGTLALIEHPEQREAFVSQPEQLDTAIEELMRFTSPVLYASLRYCTEDVELCGHVFERGTVVFPAVASANHDEDVFDEPGRLDLTRSPNRHLGFGQGVHYCLGAPLARLEAGIALTQLLSRFPDIQLTVPKSELTWRYPINIRTPTALPMRVR